MKKVLKKRIISLIIVSMMLVSGLVAKTSIALNAGTISSIFFYDQNGVLINDIASSHIDVNDTLVLKSTSNKAVFTYKYGNIVIDKESILVIMEKNSNFTFYLIDGSVKISSKATSIGTVSVITPVTSYSFNGEGDIHVISTDETESFELYSGTTTVYNNITGKTYNVHENNKMELNSPKLIAFNELDKKDSRAKFINTEFPLGITAISKSDDKIDQYTLNILATGNGQGNVNLLNFATFKGILDAADKKNNKYLLIDAGNTLAGSVYVNQDKGETASKVLEKVGYDVFVPGSYDFAYGYKQLQKLDNDSKVNFVSSNVLTSDNNNILAPYQLYAFNDLRIAVFGLSNPSELTKLDNLKFNSNIIIDEAQSAIDIAKQYVDLVILVTNYNDEQINSRIIAKNINGIDVIIDGSRSIAGTAKEGDTYIISTGVGYNKIIDTQISVFKNNIISINPVIIHSSNIAVDTKNKLASSLEVYDYKDSEDVLGLLSKVTVKDGLSSYLIPPNSSNISFKETSNLPKAPVFSKFTIRKFQPNDIDEINNIIIASPKFISNKTEENYLTGNNSSIEMEEKNKAIGIKTKLEFIPTIDNFDFDSYTIPARAYAIPYYKSKNLTVAFNFDIAMANLLDGKNSTFENNITPFPTTNHIRSIYRYAIKYVNEISIRSNNNMFNLKLKNEQFDSNIMSSLVYRKLGSNNLTFNSNLEIGPLHSQVFMTDPTLVAYYENVNYKEMAGIVETLTLDDYNLVIQASALAVGQGGKIDTFPVLSTTYTLLKNSYYSLGFNINGATLIKLRPSIIFGTMKENFLVGSSLIFKAGNTTVKAGADYLITSDVDNFNINMLYRTFNRNDLLTKLDTNTIAPYISLDTEIQNIKAHIGYSLPVDLNDQKIEKDMIDFSFDYKSDNFSTGLFYVQGNLISDIQNFTTLKNFLYSDHTEFGVNASWRINDMISSDMKAGVTSNLVNPLFLNLSFTLDLNKKF